MSLSVTVVGVGEVEGKVGELVADDVEELVANDVVAVGFVAVMAVEGVALDDLARRKAGMMGQVEVDLLVASEKNNGGKCSVEARLSFIMMY